MFLISMIFLFHSRARSNEASALGRARREAIRETDEKWQGIVAEQAEEIAKLRAQLANK